LCEVERQHWGCEFCAADVDDGSVTTAQPPRSSGGYLALSRRSTLQRQVDASQPSQGPANPRSRTRPGAVVSGSWPSDRESSAAARAVLEPGEPRCAPRDTVRHDAGL